MKRFTETEKWRDPWFRKLSPSAKLLFLWLVDNCDKAGVIDLDFESASFDIGQPIKTDHLIELESRIAKLANGKICLPKFISFQYGTLSEKCAPHSRVFEAIRSHGLSYPILENSSTTLSHTLPATLAYRVEERKGKEEYRKGKEEEGGAGGNNGDLDPVFVRDLKAAYRRPPDSRMSHMEEATLAEIIRERPRYRDEWDVIVTLKQKEPRYFPQSLSKLLIGWQDTLDRASVWVPDAKPAGKTLLDKEIERLERM